MNLSKPIFAPGDWSLADQAMHRALWSAFVGLTTDYDVKRFNDRYRLTEIRKIAELVCAQLQPDDKEVPNARISRSILRFALWTLVPHLGILDHDLAGRLRAAFKDEFGYEAVAIPMDGPDRPLLPEIRELGIERPLVVTKAFRASTHVRLEAVVARPIDSLRTMVYPWNWSSCPFWAVLPPREETGLGVWNRTCKAAVRLPGGDRIEPPPWSKERPVELDLEVVHSPFATRLDYEGRETREMALEAAREEEQRPVQAPAANREPPRKPPLFEVCPFRGYWLIEKMPGRPGTCRVVAEREAAFDDINHALFCKETLWYWLASELVAFVEACA